MTSYFRNRRFILRNLAVWTSFYLLFMGAQYLGSAKGDYTGYEQTSAGFILLFILFYGHFFICETLFHQKRAAYFLSLLALLAGYLLFIYWLLVRQTAGLFTPAQRAVTVIYLSLFFAITILLSGFYWSALFAGKKIKENTAMQLALQQMANEKMLAEKKFLQLQVNPHFLYNTLNFLYARSLNGDPALSDGIMTLSEIMRYSLQKNEDAKGLVSLEDEVTHLKNVIHIHQLRFSGKLRIVFSVSGNLRNAGILPFVLITPVENALKHGQLNDPLNPVQINLLCDEDKQKIFFSVINAKREGPKERSTGIGLDNTTRRLQWMYGENYSFGISNEKDCFKAQLTVPLYTNT
jgi:LytS/YehU family sensor histidine kinase